MPADTVIGYLNFPADDPRATPVLIDLSLLMTRTPTTVQLNRVYYPVGMARLGYRYSVEGHTDGQTPAPSVITVPAVEATALGSAAVAI